MAFGVNTSPLNLAGVVNAATAGFGATYYVPANIPLPNMNAFIGPIGSAPDPSTQDQFTAIHVPAPAAFHAIVRRAQANETETAPASSHPPAQDVISPKFRPLFQQPPLLPIAPLGGFFPGRGDAAVRVYLGGEGADRAAIMPFIMTTAAQDGAGGPGPRPRVRAIRDAAAVSSDDHDDSARSPAVYRPAVGADAFHAEYGRVRVTSYQTMLVKNNGEEEVPVEMIGITLLDHAGRRFFVRYEPEKFAPLDEASPRYRQFFQRTIDIHRFLPQAVGYSFLFRFQTHFGGWAPPFLNLWGTHKQLLSTAVRATVAADETWWGNRMRGNFVARVLGVQDVSGTKIPDLTRLNAFFWRIYEITGIDVVARAFEYIGGRPEVLEGMLSPARGTSPVFLHVTPDVIRHYAAARHDVYALAGHPRGSNPMNAWAVDDSQKIPRLIGSNPALKKAPIVVAMPDAGHPARDEVAAAVADKTGKKAVLGLWMPLAPVPPEATGDPRRMTEWAMDAYRTRKSNEIASKAGIPGNTVILILEAGTPQESSDAAVLKLMRSGAKGVLRIAVPRAEADPGKRGPPNAADPSAPRKRKLPPWRSLDTNNPDWRTDSPYIRSDLERIYKLMLGIYDARITGLSSLDLHLRTARPSICRRIVQALEKNNRSAVVPAETVVAALEAVSISAVPDDAVVDLLVKILQGKISAKEIRAAGSSRDMMGLLIADPDRFRREHPPR